MCGFVDGYDWIEGRVRGALEDPAVGAVVLLIDSPGGDVAGLEESVRRMVAARVASGKRVIAYVDELAASAAYWIAASVADEIVVPTAGRVGSIGCIGAFVDESRANEAAGVDVTVVRVPDGKAALSSVAPVADVAKARLTADVSAAAGRFFLAMSSARGFSVADVVALNGAVLSGADAVAGKLADRVGTLEGVLDRAAAAATERKAAMQAQKQAARALGMSEDATAEQIFEAVGAVSVDEQIVGCMVMDLAGQVSPDAVIATVEAWKHSHETAQEERAALRAERQRLEDDSRKDLIVELVKAGWETPATAWAIDSDGVPVVGKPSAALAAMSIDALRARAETLCAQPRAIGGAAAAPTVPDGTEGLTEIERQWCEAKGVDPVVHARNKARVSAAFKEAK